MTLDANGNLQLGGNSSLTTPKGVFALYNAGTVPTGSITNGIILYAEDVSSSSELKVRDEAGNVTTLSPHNFSLFGEDYETHPAAWSYYSERTTDTERTAVNADMYRTVRLVEQLARDAGLLEEDESLIKLVHETFE